MKTNPNAVRRRERRRASASVNEVADALKLSQRLAARGKLRAAEAAARLAERHAKIAESFVDLRASLRRIAKARYEAERGFIEACMSREASLKQRADKLALSEFALAPPKKLYSAPIERPDPWEERFKEP